MADQVADFILSRLRDWNIRHVFGYPGDGINGIVSAFGRADDNPQFVQTRHEEMAAFAATGYAKFTGGVGVCTATSGPGAVHLLNGLYDAKLDHVPVVASRRSTCKPCSRTWPATTWSRSMWRLSSPTHWTARSARR
jgi:pyruvate dehydrogenase (quinone)